MDPLGPEAAVGLVLDAGLLAQSAVGGMPSSQGCVFCREMDIQLSPRGSRYLKSEYLAKAIP